MQVSSKTTEQHHNFMSAKQHSHWYASPKINEASNMVLFFFLNLNHGNYLNNYSRTILHKSIVINNTVSHFLKEPISTYNSNLNVKYACILYNLPVSLRAAWSFHWAHRRRREKNKQKRKVSSLETIQQLYTALSASVTKSYRKAFCTNCSVSMHL